VCHDLLTASSVAHTSPVKYKSEDADVRSKDCNMLHNPLHLGTGPAGDHWGLYVYWESCTGWGYSSPGKQVWDHWDVLISTAVFFCDADIEPHYCNGIRTSSYWELRNPHKSTSHVLPGLRSINFIAIEYHQPIILGTSEMIFTTYHFRQDWSESDWSNKIQIGYQQSALNCWWDAAFHRTKTYVQCTLYKYKYKTNTNAIQI